MLVLLRRNFCLLIITAAKNADTIFLNINHFRMSLLLFAHSAAKTLFVKCILRLQLISKAKVFTEPISNCAYKNFNCALIGFIHNAQFLLRDFFAYATMQI